MELEFIYCPWCKSGNLKQTDYEDENGKEDIGGRRCLDCGWEGDEQELVCKEERG